MRAGFLCDVMGLGKTLESLMLVMANPPPEGWAVSNLAEAPPRSSRDVSLLCTRW